MPKRRSRTRAHYAHVGGVTVAFVAGTIRQRGKPISLPKWWMDELRAKYERLQRSVKLTKVQLAKDLSKAVDRKPPWDNRAVERFLSNETTTIEMMRAFLRIWPSLVPPVFIARSRADAEHIIDFLRGGDRNPEWSNRYMELTDALLEVAEPVLDQTPALTSTNGDEDVSRESAGRRSRRMD